MGTCAHTFGHKLDDYSHPDMLPCAHLPVTSGVGAPLLPALAHTGVCTCVRQPVFPCADRLDDVVGAWEHAPASRPNIILSFCFYYLIVNIPSIVTGIHWYIFLLYSAQRSYKDILLD